MASEVPKFQPLSENSGKEKGIYIPSSWEAAFDSEIQKRFSASLQEHFIDNHGSLVRVSPLTIVNDKLLAFQYTRFDILKSKEYIVDAYTQLHSKVVLSEGTVENVWDQVQLETEEEERVEEEIINAVIARDGQINAYRALTDRRYYLEGLTLQRWPENFEFVIFEDSTRFDQNSQPELIDRHGMFNGKRPDVYGSLSLPPKFEGVRHNRTTEGVLLIAHPKSYFETARAYAVAFAHETLEAAEKTGIEIEDVAWFPSTKPMEHPIFPDLDSPEQVMEEVGLFIQELTNPDS